MRTRQNDTGSLSGDQETLSRRLKEAREYLGLSQELVADHLGIPRAAVSSIETAKRRVSGLELKKLAKLYRRPYEYFFGEDDLSEGALAEKEANAGALYRASKELSPRDQEQVLRFAQFLSHAGPPPAHSTDAQSEATPDDSY